MRKTVEQRVASLVGQVITTVYIDQWSVTLLTLESAVITEGHWTLFDSAGVAVDSDCEDIVRQDFKLWKALGTTIVASNISRDNHLKLVFDNGLQLEVRSDDDGYEDWHLNSEGGLMLIVNDKTITTFS